MWIYEFVFKSFRAAYKSTDDDHFFIVFEYKRKKLREIFSFFLFPPFWEKFEFKQRITDILVCYKVDEHRLKIKRKKSIWNISRAVHATYNTLITMKSTINNITLQTQTRYSRFVELSWSCSSQNSFPQAGLLNKWKIEFWKIKTKTNNMLRTVLIFNAE